MMTAPMSEDAGEGGESIWIDFVASGGTRPAELSNGWPHVGVSEQGRATLEWWCGERKITMYPCDGMLLKVWGPNIHYEMEEVFTRDGESTQRAFKWLRAGLTASDSVPLAANRMDKESASPSPNAQEE